MATARSAFTVTPWTNQHLVVYHGTLDTHVGSILGGINLAHSRVHTDFGRGFYTTTVERQARAWAWSLAQRSPGTAPAVVRFAVDRDQLAALECVCFVRGSFDADDFWGLVYRCRTLGQHHARVMNAGWYDMVVGPVAASWRQRLMIYDADQIGFCTPRAISLLNGSNPSRLP